MYNSYEIIFKEEKPMKDALKQIEIILIDMWNYLYRFLCHITGTDVNEDWILDPTAND